MFVREKTQKSFVCHLFSCFISVVRTCRTVCHQYLAWHTVYVKSNPFFFQHKKFFSSYSLTSVLVELNQVFVDALDDAPVHARRALFSTLVDALGEESRAIMSALLLRQAVSAVSVSGVGSKPASVDEEETAALVEFVHQTVHCSGVQAQVRTEWTCQILRSIIQYSVGNRLGQLSKLVVLVLRKCRRGIECRRGFMYEC